LVWSTTLKSDGVVVVFGLVVMIDLLWMWTPRKPLLAPVEGLAAVLVAHSVRSCGPCVGRLPGASSPFHSHPMEADQPHPGGWKGEARVAASPPR